TRPERGSRRRDRRHARGRRGERALGGENESGGGSPPDAGSAYTYTTCYHEKGGPLRFFPLAASIFPPSRAGHSKEFRSADVHPLDYRTVLAVGEMGRLVSERTKGRHSIKVYGNSALGGEKDTIEQVRIGALDMIRINVAPMNNVVPETMVPTMPFVF